MRDDEALQQRHSRFVSGATQHYVVFMIMVPTMDDQDEEDDDGGIYDDYDSP